MSSAKSRVKQIAFATCGDGQVEPTSGRPVIAYASVDVDDEEAERLLLGARGTFAGACEVVGSDGYVPLPRPGAMRSLVEDIQGRFQYGLHDRRPFIASRIVGLVFDATIVGKGEEAERARLRREFVVATTDFLSSSEENLTHLVRGIDEASAAGDPEALVELIVLHLPPSQVARTAFIAAHRGAIVQHLERFRPRSFGALVDQDDFLGALHAHNETWGRRHRRISTICASGPVLEALGGFFPPTVCRRPYLGPAREGHWRAWRQSGPIETLGAGGSPALQLAGMVAAIAIALRSPRERGVYDGVAAAFERHYLGDDVFAPEGWQDATTARLWRRVEEESIRDMRWEFEHEHERRLPDALRLSRRIVGRDLISSRDRLLLKMTGRGLGPGATLPLRVEALNVNAFDDLFDLSWTPDAPILKMDSGDADDLWTLVRANEGSEGFLFSPVENSTPYGRRGLARSEYDSIVHARLEELFPQQTEEMPA